MYQFIRRLHSQKILIIIICLSVLHTPRLHATEAVTITTFLPAPKGGGGATGDIDIAQTEDDHVHIGLATHLATNNYEGKLWIADESTQTDPTSTPDDTVVPDIVLQNTSDTDDNYNRILFVNSVGGVDSAIAAVHKDAAASSNTLNGTLQFLTANATGLNPKMTISSAGDVGISTTTPIADLHIKNTTPYTLGEDDYLTDSIALYGAFTTNRAYFGGITWHNDTERAAGIVSVMESADSDDVGLAFMTQEDYGTTTRILERMRISHNGYVDIGNVKPATSPLTIYTREGQGPAIELVGLTPSIKLTTGNLNETAYFKYDSITQDLIAENLGGNIMVKTYYSNHFKMNARGNVQIGTDEPSDNKLLSLTMSPSYGIYMKSNGAPADNTAIYNQSNGGGGVKYGLYNVAGTGLANEIIASANTSTSTGLYNYVLGSGDLYGVQNYFYGNQYNNSASMVTANMRGNAGEKCGLYSSVSGTTTNTGHHYGVYSEVSGYTVFATGYIYGARVESYSGTAGTSIGVYGNGVDADFLAEHGTYTSNSSRRWKTNITTLSGAMDKIMALKGVSFDWDKAHGGRHSLGFIAEEVGAVLPEIVVYEKDDSGNAKSMDYSKISAVLVEAIKEQQALILNQATKIQAQTKRIEQIQLDSIAIEQQIQTLKSNNPS